MNTPADPKPNRYPVGAIALSLIFLIFGVAGASVYRSHEESIKLQDREFLQKQLQRLDEAGTTVSRPARPLALIRVDHAQTGELPSIRTFQGRLQEVKNTTLASEVNGLVLALPVEVGDVVKAGETLIARIDDTWTKFTHETSGREIELRSSVLEYEKSEMERLRQLVRTQAVSQSEFQLQVNKADQIRINLEIAKLTFSEAAEKLKRTEILAPFDGHVVAKMTEVGSLLAPGNPIVQIISSGEIDAVIPVNQTVISRIKLGDEISVDIHNLDMKIPGKVHKTVPYAPSEGARMFPVYIRLPNNDDRLKSGMAVSALIPESEPKRGIIIPVEAMMDKPDGRTVWVATPRAGETPTVQNAGGTPAVQQQIVVNPVPVKLLAHAVDRCSVEAETVEGRGLLTSNAMVVIEGSERLTPGQLVVIKEVDPRFLEDLPTGSGHAIVREAETEEEEE